MVGSPARRTLLQVGRRLDRVRDAVDGLDELRVLVSRVRGDRLLRQRLEDCVVSYDSYVVPRG